MLLLPLYQFFVLVTLMTFVVALAHVLLLAIEQVKNFHFCFQRCPVYFSCLCSCLFHWFFLRTHLVRLAHDLDRCS
uniref:Uncharacterized protein n=1 Tax=Amblyomma parvum TaxID=251391 RepID=A0A023G224_AMBPA